MISSSSQPHQESEGFPASLSRFELLAHQGEGRYRVMDPQTQTPQLLRVFQWESPRARETFLFEAESFKRLRHPYLLSLLEAGDAEDRGYVLLEDAGDLNLEEAASRMSLEEKLLAILDVADGVQALHRAGLNHGRISARNIWVEALPKGGWKVGLGDCAPSQDGSESKKRSSELREDTRALGLTLIEILKASHDASSAPTESGATSQPEDPSCKGVGDSNPSDQGLIQSEKKLQKILEACGVPNGSITYDSPRALADDLRRFLAGEPLLSPRLAGSERALAWIRSHPLHAFTFALGLLVILVSLTWGLDRIWGERRTRVAIQQLDREVDQIEMILRQIHAQPAHDLRPEINLLRQRLHKIEDLMQEDRWAVAPGHWALGRAFGLLGDAPKHWEHLEQAWRLGFRSPKFQADLGISRLDRYQTQWMALTSLQLGSKDLEATRSRLRQELMEPGMLLCQQAQPQLDEPQRSLIGARMAIAQGRYPAALTLYRQLRKQQPWNSDLLSDMARAHRDQALAIQNNEEAREALDEALDSLREAIRYLPSRPTLRRLEAECLFLRSKLPGSEEASDRQMAFQALEEGLMLHADSLDLLRLQALEKSSRNQLDGLSSSQLASLLDLWSRILDLNKDDFQAYLQRARVLEAIALQKLRRREPALDQFRLALSDHENVFRRTLLIQSSLVDLLRVLDRLAALQLEVGENPAPAIDRGISLPWSSGPNEPLEAELKLELCFHHLQFSEWRGERLEKAPETAVAALARMKAEEGRSLAEGRLARRMARHLPHTGSSQERQRAIALLTEATQTQPKSSQAHLELAQALLESFGKKPISVDEAHQIFIKVQEQIKIALQLAPRSTEVHEALASLYLARARQTLWMKRNPRTYIQEGFNAVEKALKLAREPGTIPEAPHEARLLAVKGRLQLLLVRYKSNHWPELARQAAATFREALRLNANLARPLEEDLREAQRLSR